jgi:hypothetical protein
VAPTPELPGLPKTGFGPVDALIERGAGAPLWLLIGLVAVGVAVTARWRRRRQVA